MADYPEDCRYTKEHEWVSLEGDLGTVGITHHAQNELGDVVFLELPSVGDRVEGGTPFGTIESVKAVSDLYAPLSGEVVEIHEELIDQPELVNEDPHGKAWIIKIRVDDAAAAQSLMTAADYREFLAESEGH